jgi:hypothetical protein
MSHNILGFPKRRSRNVENFAVAEAKQVFVSLSLVALVVASVIVNDQVLKEEKPLYLVSDNPSQVMELNRAIASSRPFNPFQEVKWEHDLAQKLAKEPEVVLRYPASLAKKISAMDQLRFGRLAGKYSILNVPVKSATGVDYAIEQISYIESLDTGDAPVEISAAEFFTNYGTTLSVPYSSYKLSSTNEGQETYHLLSPDKKVVGEVVFRKDEKQHFMGLQVRRASIE